MKGYLSIGCFLLIPVWGWGKRTEASEQVARGGRFSLKVEGGGVFRGGAQLPPGCLQGAGAGGPMFLFGAEVPTGACGA